MRWQGSMCALQQLESSCAGAHGTRVGGNKDHTHRVQWEFCCPSVRMWSYHDIGRICVVEQSVPEGVPHCARAATATCTAAAPAPQHWTLELRAGPWLRAITAGDSPLRHLCAVSSGLTQCKSVSVRQRRQACTTVVPVSLLAPPLYRALLGPLVKLNAAYTKSSRDAQLWAAQSCLRSCLRVGGPRPACRLALLVRLSAALR